MSPDERFDSKYVVAPSGCWIWTGGRSTAGYGVFWLYGKQELAHRLSYIRDVGPISAGKQIDHLCRRRACVKPSHLQVVTIRINLLRGSTNAARNAAKTHCPQNHPYDHANTAYNKAGGRVCRECRKTRLRRLRAAA